MLTNLAERAGVIPPEELAALAGGGTAGGELEDIPDGNYVQQFGVTVICEDEAHQQEVFERLQAEGLDVRVVVT
jgi:hypothetical protein